MVVTAGAGMRSRPTRPGGAGMAALASCMMVDAADVRAVAVRIDDLKLVTLSGGHQHVIATAYSIGSLAVYVSAVEILVSIKARPRRSYYY